MKYISFILSLNRLNFTIVVFFFLILSTILEYLFVISIPYLLNIIFTENFSFLNFIFFYGYDKEYNLRIIFFLIFIFFFKKNICYFLSQYFFLKYSFKIHNNLSSLIFTKYLKDKYIYFVNSKVSELLRNVKDNVELVRNLVNNMFTLVSEILVFVGLCFIVIYNSSLLSIFSIFFIILFSILYLYFSRNLSNQWSLKRQASESLKIKFIQESFSGFKELKLFNKEDLFIKNYNQSNSSSNKMNFKFNLLYSFPRIYLEIVGSLGIIILIVFNLEESKKNSLVSIIPLLGLYFVAFIRLLPSANRILNSIETNRYAFPALKLIFNDLKNHSKFNNHRNNYKSKKNKIIFMNKININKLTFLFSKNEIFKNINLEIKIKDKIAIIGESGIGKTTFLNLLSGLLEPSKGSILCDGININKNIESYRNNISYITQSTFLMNDTIENNISFNSYKDELHSKKVIKAINLANLNNLINKLPKGIDSIVGDDGSKLSGGQIQRIGIARALYFDREILICDEITNSLDSISEKSIINCLKELDKTIIIISHKRQNLNFCSKIYEIKNKKFSLIRNL
jgi:ATP-binding cassette subfamily C protein